MSGMHRTKARLAQADLNGFYGGKHQPAAVILVAQSGSLCLHTRHNPLRSLIEREVIPFVKITFGKAA